MLWTSFATSIVVLKTPVVRKFHVHHRTRPERLNFTVRHHKLNQDSLAEGARPEHADADEVELNVEPLAGRGLGTVRNLS